MPQKLDGLNFDPDGCWLNRMLQASEQDSWDMNQSQSNSFRCRTELYFAATIKLIHSTCCLNRLLFLLVMRRALNAVAKTKLLAKLRCNI